MLADPAELRELMAHLSGEEVAELDQLLTAGEPIWRPLPGPQTLVMRSTAQVIGFGGAAGGGKSDVGIGLALTSHRRIAIFRREATQLLGVIDRITDILGSRDGYSSQPHNVWRISPTRYPVDRSVQIEFGSTPHLGDEKRYQGRPKDLLVLDEATEFLEAQARFLMGWVRTTVPGQQCQTLMTFNPPTTAEGRWVLQFFAPWLDDAYPVPAAPGEIRWFAMVGGKEIEVAGPTPFTHQGELITPQSRTFVPSRISDNPYLVSTGYMAQLQALPEPLRSQMLYGDFRAGVEDDAYQVIPTRWIERAMERWVDRSPAGEMSSMGVDVSRGGRDKTVVARRHGMWFASPIRVDKKDTQDGHDVAAVAIANVRDRAPIHIDVIGVGASPYDILRKARQHVLGVNVAEAATKLDKSGRLQFLNLRAQLWWMMREALDPDADTGIALPPDPELKADLAAPRWELSGRSVKVESRESLVKRLGRSVDVGTAYILALMDTPKVHALAAIRELGADVNRERGHNPYDIMD